MSQVTAYAIVDLEVFDIEHYLAYQRAVAPLLEGVGARYLARGGESLVLEGDYQPNRLILVEFPSLEVMQDFYQSDGYRNLEAQRMACSRARILGVEGL
jgi:uncharacterized protein (DUF1330 family)